MQQVGVLLDSKAQVSIIWVSGFGIIMNVTFLSLDWTLLIILIRAWFHTDLPNRWLRECHGEVESSKKYFFLFQNKKAVLLCFGFLFCFFFCVCVWVFSFVCFGVLLWFFFSPNQWTCVPPRVLGLLSHCYLGLTLWDPLATSASQYSDENPVDRKAPCWATLWLCSSWTGT